VYLVADLTVPFGLGGYKVHRFAVGAPTVFDQSTFRALMRNRGCAAECFQEVVIGLLRVWQQGA
jgi:hypothetical protein